MLGSSSTTSNEGRGICSLYGAPASDVHDRGAWNAGWGPRPKGHDLFLRHAWPHDNRRAGPIVPVGRARSGASKKDRDPSVPHPRSSLGSNAGALNSTESADPRLFTPHPTNVGLGGEYGLALVEQADEQAGQV